MRVDTRRARCSLGRLVCDARPPRSWGPPRLGVEVVEQVGGSRLPPLVKFWIGHVVVCVLDLSHAYDVFNPSAPLLWKPRKVVDSFTSAAVARNTTSTRALFVCFFRGARVSSGRRTPCSLYINVVTRARSRRWHQRVNAHARTFWMRFSQAIVRTWVALKQGGVFFLIKRWSRGDVSYYSLYSSAR